MRGVSISARSVLLLACVLELVSLVVGAGAQDEVANMEVSLRFVDEARGRGLDTRLEQRLLRHVCDSKGVTC